MSGIKIQHKGLTLEFGVMHLPNRKQPALYIVMKNQARILAYFRSENDADMFQEYIDKLLPDEQAEEKARGGE